LGRIRRATELQPDAIQVTLPDWLPLSPDEVLRTIEGYARASKGIPIVLYNPPYAKTRLTLRALGELGRRFDALIGIKVAGGDALWYQEMRATTGDLAVFVPGHTLATGIAEGAHGSYSNVVSLSPGGAVAWYRLMSSDPAAAKQVEARIARLFATAIEPLQALGYCDPALDKALACAGAWTAMSATMRWPYSGVPRDEVDRLATEARNLVPELFHAMDGECSLRRVQAEALTGTNSERACT
jgi:dihydrodipicolinate synthase/N-acetylneuraminate lyase